MKVDAGGGAMNVVITYNSKKLIWLTIKKDPNILKIF